MKKFTLLLFLLSVFALSAQDLVSPKKLMTQYENKLNLTKDQAIKFSNILEEYYDDLYKKEIDDKTFNKLNKLRDLEFYKIMTKEQFSIYKKAKKEIEPQLKFRFK
ncbi:MAG: hypothetical protein R2785_09710 [Flavobacteriaceae bacterium]